MTKASEKTNYKVQEEFKIYQVICIHYPFQFSKFPIETLIDSNSKINAMQPSVVTKIDLGIYKTNVSTLKIDDSKLKTYEMVIAMF